MQIVMATITPLLNDLHTTKDGLYPVVVKVQHQHQRRYIPTGYRIEKKHWTGSQVIGRHPKANLINEALTAKMAEARKYIADCQLHGKPIRLDLIGAARTSYSFTDYLDRRAAQYKAANKIIMDRKVRRFALELRTCFRHAVYFEDINLDTLRQLEQWQIDQGNVNNTRHKKFKFLGQFYGQAMKEGKAAGPNPFLAYKIAQKPVKKDKLTEVQIKALEDLALSPGPVNDARNIFLFSYYAKGQRCEVCVTLRRTQVHNGRIFFRTNKGNAYLSVKIHARLQSILDRYPEGEFVFPYITTLPDDPKKYLSLIDSANTIINRNLKIVAAMASLPVNLTMHLARHSFAYQLKQVTDNINVISDALGHSDQRITQAYLKSLEDERLDSEMEKLYGK